MAKRRWVALTAQPRVVAHKILLLHFYGYQKKREEKGREKERRGEEKEREISETSAANHKNFVACILTLFLGFFFISTLVCGISQGRVRRGHQGQSLHQTQNQTLRALTSPAYFRGWETSPKLLPAGAGIGHRVAIIVYRLPFDWAAIRMPITRPVNGSQTRGLRLPLQAIFWTNFCDIQQKKYFPLAKNSIRTFQFRLDAWKRTEKRAKGIAKFPICKLFFDTVMRLQEIRLWQTSCEATTWRRNTLWEKNAFGVYKRYTIG